MGGLRKAAAAHEDRVPDRLARARRPAAARRLLLEGRDHRLDARPRRLVRLPAVRRLPRRHVPHRPLRVPPLLHRLLRRADRRSRRSTCTSRRAGSRGRSRWSGRSPSSPSSRPSPASCSSRRSGTRSRPGSTRSRRRSPSRRRPRTRSRSISRRCSASPASGSPTAVYVDEAHPVPQAGHAVREEVLLRRALRRGLLQARRPDLARPRPRSSSSP